MSTVRPKFSLEVFKRPLELRTGSPQKLKPSDLKAHLDKYVVGQDDAKKALAISIVNHINICEYNSTALPEDRIKRTNLMLVGSSGSGKTLMLERIAEFLSIPLFTIDATKLTPSGYKGENVSDAMSRLLEDAEGERGVRKAIIFIDEIDKIVDAGFGSDSDDGFRTTAIQIDLLKFIEGGYSNGAVSSKEMLFVFGGAFTNFRKEKMKAKRSIGITGKVKKQGSDHKMTHNDLIESGMMPEFVGRIGHIAQLERLTKEQMKCIITEPKDSVAKQMEVLSRLRGIDLTLTDKEIDEIVNEAMEMDTGARAIRILTEQKLFDRMYT